MSWKREGCPPPSFCLAIRLKKPPASPNLIYFNPRENQGKLSVNRSVLCVKRSVISRLISIRGGQPDISGREARQEKIGYVFLTSVRFRHSERHSELFSVNENIFPDSKFLGLWTIFRFYKHSSFKKSTFFSTIFSILHFFLHFFQNKNCRILQLFCRKKKVCL